MIKILREFFYQGTLISMKPNGMWVHAGCLNIELNKTPLCLRCERRIEIDDEQMDAHCGYRRGLIHSRCSGKRKLDGDLKMSFQREIREKSFSVCKNEF